MTLISCIFLSVIWTLYSAFKVEDHKIVLLQEAPHCFTGLQPNPNRELITMATILFLVLTKSPIEQMARQLFEKHFLPPAKFPLNSDLRESKGRLLGERVYKVIVNGMSVAALYSIMLREDCDFLDTRMGGRIEHPMYMMNYPCQKLPMFLDEFYIMKLSLHVYELTMTLVHQRARRDFMEYFLHHYLTAALIYFSYSLNYIPIGAAVMLLHDVTDLTVSVFKLTIDVTPMAIQLSGYGLMVTSWVYFRIWFFPGHIISRIYEECHSGRINVILLP